MSGEPERCASVLGDGALSDAQAGAWIGFQRAHRELTRRLEADLHAHHGLSLSALELLGRLAAAERRQRRLARLAEDVELSLSRVSRIVDALERRGLVERRPCPEDTRATEAHLTDAGLALVREAQAGHLDRVRRDFLDRLDGEELRTLGRVFARLAGDGP